MIRAVLSRPASVAGFLDPPGRASTFVCPMRGGLCVLAAKRRFRVRPSVVRWGPRSGCPATDRFDDLLHLCLAACAFHVADRTALIAPGDH